MASNRGKYEIRKFAVAGPGAEPTTQGVRVGQPKEPLTARNDLNWIARHHQQTGDTVVSFNSQSSLCVRKPSGAHTLYRVLGPLMR